MIEIATFSLLSSATDDAFVEADAAVQQRFAYHQPGLLRRTVARGDDGRWAVITWWDSEDTADRAAAAARTSPVVASLTALVDQSTIRLERWSPLP